MTRRLEAGPLLVTLGAVLLLASLFLSWYDGDATAWHVFEVWDVVLLVLAVGGIVLGIGLLVPELEALDRRWLPAGVAAVAIIVASQIVDPPPAASGLDADVGAWLALGSALVMCIGAILTFGRVHLAFTIEGRDPRQHVAAVDAREPADPTTETHAVPASGDEPASRGARRFSPAAGPGGDSAADEPPPADATPPSEPAPGAVSADGPEQAGIRSRSKKQG